MSDPPLPTVQPTPGDTSASGPYRDRAPLAALSLALVEGILVDRWLDFALPAWIVVGVGAVLLAWWWARRSDRWATVFVILACVAVGGARHQLNWSSLAVDDISRIATVQPRPIKVLGVIESPVEIVTADESAMTPPWMQTDRSMCTLRCESIETVAGRHPVSGRVRLGVTGDLIHAEVGDRILVVGRLQLPRGPTNPGAFDFRDYLRRQRVRALLECNHPDGVQVVAARVAGDFARWRATIRQECQRVFTMHLDPRTAPLASSLLLGERRQLPFAVREAFVESGTMHLLAISGLHVGILAGLLLILCRLFNISLTATTVVVLGGVILFACITNLRPPVVRASVLAVVVAAGWPAYRQLGAVNLLAVCALVVLLIRPTDLFDTGTQLSFLAVMAIGWAAEFIARQRQSVDEESLLPRLFARKPGVVRTLVRFLAEGYVVTSAIWLFTLPLTMQQFHVAAPVGFVINVLLIPYVALVLALGFCTMAFGLLAPWLVTVPAGLLNLTLHGLLCTVDAASAVQLGHTYLRGPTVGWLIVFYLLLAGVLVFGRWWEVRRWGWPVVWGWVIAGQLLAMLPGVRPSLRCTVLDVGHGCCIVLELPNGQTVMYDAGMLGSEHRGLRVIQSALWDLGIHRVDAIVISHADVDHFNAAAGLVQTVPVGMLLCHRSLLAVSQDAVEALCVSVTRSDVPIRFLLRGDRLGTFGSGVEIDVLHPDDAWLTDHDNDNSLVLRIRFAGRTLLLTGDLEQVGLRQLMTVVDSQAVDSPVDILLAPHHGSQGSNPPELGHLGPARGCCRQRWRDGHLFPAAGDLLNGRPCAGNP